MYSEGPSPVKPLLLIGLAVLGITLPWYMSYEPVVEDVQAQWGLLMIILPVLILVAIVCMAAGTNALNYILPQSDPSSIHRVGGSPVGLGILLLIVLTMVWYHSDIIDSWNPFIRG